MKLVSIVLAATAACAAPAKPPPPPPSNRAVDPPTTAEGAQYVGDPRAQIQIVYWFDYACPPCRGLSSTIDAIEARYGNRIVVYYKNFQLERHPEARIAAIAAEAARRQGKYIEMHRLLMHGEPELDASALHRDATQLGLDLAQFDADFADASSHVKVDDEYAEGERLGLDHVPVLSINGVPYGGDLSETALTNSIDARLAQ